MCTGPTPGWLPTNPLQMSDLTRGGRGYCGRHNAEGHMLEPMNRADLIAIASPPCHECGESVGRKEMPWHPDEDRRWRRGPCCRVGTARHRVVGEPFE